MKYIVISIDNGDGNIEELFRYPIQNHIDTSNTFHKVESIEDIILKYLTDIGIPSSLKGKKYLVESILYAIEKDYNVNFTKELYPYLAEKYSETPISVERNIRHSITKLFQYGKHDILNEVFGKSDFLSKGKLTNKEFIYCSAEYIKLHYY